MAKSTPNANQILPFVITRPLSLVVCVLVPLALPVRSRLFVVGPVFGGPRNEVLDCWLGQIKSQAFCQQSGMAGGPVILPQSQPLPFLLEACSLQHRRVDDAVGTTAESHLDHRPA